MKTEIDRMTLRAVRVTKAGRPYMDIADLLKHEVNRIEKSKRPSGTSFRVLAATIPARQQEDKPVHE